MYRTYWFGDPLLNSSQVDKSKQAVRSIVQRINPPSARNRGDCAASWNRFYYVEDNQIKVYSPDFAEQSLRELQESTTHRDITAVAAAWDRVCLSTTTCQRRDAAVPTMSTDRSVETGDGPTHELVVLDGVHSSDRLKWRITSCPVPFSCTSVSCSDASIITVAGNGQAWCSSRSGAAADDDDALNEGGGKTSADASCVSLLALERLSWPVALSCVSCGKDHVLLLDRLGRVASYGIGSRGQLGHGDVASIDPPAGPRLVEALDGVRCLLIAAGGWHSLALMESGDVYSWGWNESGQLGIESATCDNEVADEATQHVVGTSADRTDPEQAEATQHSRGTAHSAAQLFSADPQLVVFPCGATSEAVDNDDPPDVTVLSISCGSRHSAAVAETGQLFTWGWGAHGQLGHTSRENCLSPLPVEYLNRDGEKVEWAMCGDWHTIVHTSTCSSGTGH
ncbi:E3 ubiquitin-protein ligase HERC2-like [Sycon ciliatum]|uniref:E3 ubiquitin-protein ligase HERC2-like n=1 Tax=Sycon ciliatum TaxID=27933 RepID=UPI0031F71185